MKLQVKAWQLTEIELRGILYEGVRLVLEGKKDQASLAAELAETMKKSLDIRLK